MLLNMITEIIFAFLQFEQLEYNKGLCFNGKHYVNFFALNTVVIQGHGALTRLKALG
jgi:hypothetical protein